MTALPPTRSPRTRRRHGRAPLLAALLAAPPALAQTVAPAAQVVQSGAAAEAADPVAILLQQAALWTAQQKPDLARTSLQKALRLDPKNPDALAALATLEAGAGHRAAAEAALAQLHAASPQDARAPRVAGAIRVGTMAPEALEEARQLARDGRYDQAVAQYDHLFAGTKPPTTLAIEYNRALSATSGGWETARDGLADLVRENPNDLQAQLAYAEILTYREGARPEGIDRLQALAHNPAVAEQATKAWRAALSWLPDGADSVAPIAAYLEVRPSDADLTAKLARAKNPPVAADPAGHARTAGFDQLNAGHLTEAAAAFQLALSLAPDNADSLGGLGIVRLRQGNKTEARTLLARAIARDPEHADRWNKALAAAEQRGGPNPATALLAAGRYAAAERELRSQIDGGDRDTGLSVLLAEAQSRQGRDAEAEQTLRAALTRRPDDGKVLVALATLLGREGRVRDSADLLAQAQAVGAGPLVAQARAAGLREQAAAEADPVARTALLRAASSAAPGDPWIRLDLARALVAAGHLLEGRAIMARGVQNGAGVDALRAGILFANETKDPDAAAALLDRLPPSARTPDMRAARAQADLQQEITAATSLDPTEARVRLLTLAARPDPDGMRGAAIARALAATGHPDSAREAIITAQAATPSRPAAARLAYAGALLEIGDTNSAQRLLAGLSGAADLTAPQRNEWAQLRAGLAVRRSDALNEQGRQAAGFDVLAPVLAARPADPDVNMALARLYLGAQRPRDAMAVALELLRRDPANAQARQVAVSAALSAGDRRRADMLVREGLQLTPLDPQTWLASADVARARGDADQALRALRRARALRLQQLGPQDAPGGFGTAGAEDRTALAMLSPEDLLPPPQGGTAPGLSVPPHAFVPAPVASPADPADAILREIDEDGDQVIVRRRMLDTEVTDLPPPIRVGPDGFAGAAPFAVDRRQPIPVTIAASVGGQDGVPDQPSIDTGPFGRSSSPPALGSVSAVPVLANPFRPSAAGAAVSAGLDPAPLADPGLPQYADLEAPLAPVDPLTARIDRDIAALTDEQAANAQAGVGFRGRTGSAGTSQLAEITVPLQASFAAGGSGRIGLAVTPTFLDAGSVPQSLGSLGQFGTVALGLTPAGASIPSQTAQGVGLDVSYKTPSFSADIGTTPQGFREQNMVGGLEWAPDLGGGVRLRLTGERRAVTDSVLSYAGTRDPGTGQSWGGVTYSRGRANLEFSAGVADLYVGGGGGVLQGHNVKSNSETEAGAGGSFPVWKDAGQELRLGLDLVYFGFARNLSGFTLGQGGYFSPESYFAALLPITFKDRPTPNLSYEIGVTAGIQTYRESSSDTYPNNADLQSALVAQQANPATAVTGVNTSLPSHSVSGFTGGAHAAVDYRVATGLHVGAKFDYQHAGDFNQYSGLLYGRYLLNGEPPR